MQRSPGVGQSAGPRQTAGTQMSPMQSKSAGQVEALQSSDGMQKPLSQYAIPVQSRSVRHAGSGSQRLSVMLQPKPVGHSPFGPHISRTTQRPSTQSSLAALSHSASSVHSGGMH